MAKQLEDELKVQNWLSILTFDVFRYAESGGRVEIEATEKGLTIVLLEVNKNSVGINKKFSRLLVGSGELLADTAEKEPTP